jgi:hypothetical protein
MSDAFGVWIDYRRVCPDVMAFVVAGILRFFSASTVAVTLLTTLPYRHSL